MKHLTLAVMLLILASQAHAAEPGLDTGDTAWMICAAMFVLMMCIPGLALFYGGMVRVKNFLSVFTQLFAVAGVIGILWVLFGYSLVVDTTGMVEGQVTWNSFVGGLDKALMLDVGHDSLIGTIPEGVFAVFQLTFAIITPALIAGGFAERMKFSASLSFMVAWFILVYAPVAHMVWGGPGALMVNWGVLDFAGGTAVHINSGVAALAAALVLGKRKGYPQVAMPPHNLGFTLVGAGMLWVGWFGFNVGSGLAANQGAGVVMLATMVAACAGIVGWLLSEKLLHGRPTALGAASGALAGLVGITPACAFVGPLGALVIGLLTGAICFLAVTRLKQALGYDDSLDVFGLHGIGGIVGALLTGVFAAPALGGYVEGVSPVAQLLVQLQGVSFTFVYCFVVSLVILGTLKWVIGLRASKEEEEQGLDLAEHNERAYNL
ncbi:MULTISPECIES: ammonium transporter [unclassified Pseudomonas]|uniref:ammonium transporter n=1 Tax=unclassified Pseudomonas TaxID=196821 RepID=UPI0021BA8339|nr:MULTISPECIES: ammonium transporter [unclassified Pseudomonas]MCT8166295.1 ammonium transporter [Pseudomonas sp. HD6422]MCT8185253.1 ammonium transporter [Pseudomonas sp. HD6421]